MTIVTLSRGKQSVRTELLDPVHCVDRFGNLFGLMRTNGIRHQWFEHCPPPQRVWEEVSRSEDDRPEGDYN